MLLSSTQTQWHLRLLGGAALYCPELRKDRLERKQAALLTILALEGAQTRSRLAGMLWADSTEQTSRNNLAQLLKRLKDFTGEPIVQGDVALRLINTKTDAVQLEEMIFAAKYETIESGTLLEGYDFEDCPDVLDWLVFQRERLNQLVLQGLTQYAMQLEQQQQLPHALEIAEKILILDNVLENSYRRIMRLQYATGQRNMALKTFERCVATLNKELGVQPSIETLRLKTQIETDEILPITPQKLELPVSVLRPKQLIGRESAWLAMQGAKAEHKAIFISAAPGMGKTRLIQDFTRQATIFKSRPGDQNLAYSSLARVYSSILETYKLDLPEWVRLELSRILPQLRQPKDTVTALQSQADQLHFYQAAAEINNLAINAGMRCVIVDDLQFNDNATFDVMKFVLSQLNNQKFDVLMAYRTGQLSPEIAQQLEQMIQTNLAVLIELEPFTLEQTQAFLTGLELDITLEPTALHTYTNGNPLYMLESIRYCLETGETLKQAPRIKQLIAQRLEQLPDKALRLAQVAAILSQDFTLERAARILEQPIFEIASTLEQLETAQIMNGENFVHDLIFEAINASVSAGVKRYLHRQIAEILSQSNLGAVAASRIAEHYIQGLEEQKALPFLEIATEHLKAQYRLLESAELYMQIAAIQIGLGNTEATCNAYESAYNNFIIHGASDRLTELVALYLRHAQTPKQHAEAYNIQNSWLLFQGDYDAALKAAFQGLEYANLSQIKSTQAVLENTIGNTLWHQNKLEQAIVHLQRSVDFKLSIVAEQTDSAIIKIEELQWAVSVQNLATCYDQLGDFYTAAQHHLTSLNVFKTQGERNYLAVSLTNYACNQIDQGYYQFALETLLEAKAVAQSFVNAPQMIGALAITLAKTQVILGQYQNALENALFGLGIIREANPSILPMILSRLAGCYRILGDFIKCKQYLDEALENAKVTLAYGFYPLIEQAYFEHWQGQISQNTLEQIQNTELNDLSIERKMQFQLMQSLTTSPTDALEIAQRIIEVASQRKFEPIRMAAQARAAAALLKLGRNSEALTYSQASLQIPEGVSPEIPLSEILLIHHQVLKANQDQNALEPLQQALALITQQRAALPLEYQETFFSNNPNNKAILKAFKNPTK